MYQFFFFFFLEIVEGLWVLSAEWMAMCIKCKQIILHDEIVADGTAHVVEEFEIKKDVKAMCSSVCRRARLDTTYRLGDKDQDKYNHAPDSRITLIGVNTSGVYLYGQFPHPRPTKTELIGLLESCGACCIHSMTDIVKFCLSHSAAGNNSDSKNTLVSLICLNMDDPFVAFVLKNILVYIWICACVTGRVVLSNTQ